MEISGELAAKACAAAAAIALAGCATNIPLVGTDEVAGGVEREAVSYNRIQKNVTNSIILENIVASRDRGSVGYSTISGITSTPEVSVSAEGNFTPLGLGNPPGPFMGSSAKFGQDTKSGANYSVTPLTQSDTSATVGILAPTPVGVFVNYWNANWPRDVLLSLFVHSASWTEKENGAETRYRIVANPENPRAFLHQLAKSPLGPREDWGATYFGDPKSDCFSLTRGDLKEMIGFGSASSSTIIEQIGKLNEHSSGVFKVVINAEGGESAGKPKGAPSFEYCTKNGSKSLFRYTTTKDSYADERTGENREIRTLTAPQPVDIEFEYRSFDSIIYYVGEILRLKSEDAKFLRDMDCVGETKSNSAELFKVYESSDRNGASFDVRARHLGKTYYAVPYRNSDAGVCHNERTGTVMTILSQLFLLNQDKKFLEAPEILLRN